MVLDPGPPVVTARGAQLVGVDAGVQAQLGDAGRELEQRPLDPPARARCAHHHTVGEHDPFLGGQPPEREPGHVLLGAVAEAEGQPEVDCELEVDVEELRAGLQRGEVTGQVADVEAPHDRPLDLGPALAPDLVEVGVVPGVLDRAGEAAVAVEEAGGVGDRPPTVGVVLGVEGEEHADVLAPVPGGGVPRPRARHHE